MKERGGMEERDTCINNASIFNSFFAAATNLLCVGKLSVIIRILKAERERGG